MNNCDCGCKSICTILAVAASVIIGIVAGFLRFSAIITVTPAFLWVTFGIAVFYLVALVFTARSRPRGCVCAALPALLTGVFATIITALVLLAVTFAATSAIAAIITGINLAAFSLILTSSVCLIRCLEGCRDND